jgi:4-hydroxy-2-oxoheptanedioate aldolase
MEVGMRANRVKQKLRDGAPSLGAWLSLGSITAGRHMARLGFDWLTVDMEHSHVGLETATHMLGAIADAGCTALARVPSNRHDHIKKVLDNGAMGVVVPMVNSRAEAEAAVSACLYPPRGTRSVGGTSHALNFGASAEEYFARADQELLVVCQIEHRQAVERADEIVSVPGIDAIFVGPNDLAASYRGADGKPPSEATIADAMAQVLKACRKHRVAAGVHCFTADDVVLRIAEGWQLLGIGSELGMMIDGVQAVLEPLRQRGIIAKFA